VPPRGRMGCSVTDISEELAVVIGGEFEDFWHPGKDNLKTISDATNFDSGIKIFSSITMYMCTIKVLKNGRLRL
jgi:hypothetical protein